MLKAELGLSRQPLETSETVSDATQKISGEVSQPIGRMKSMHRGVGMSVGSGVKT